MQILRSLTRTASLLRKADEARDKNDWIESAILYRSYLRRNPQNSSIWVQLGHSLKESGNLFEAQDAYARALALTPQSADAHLQMGHLRKLKGDTADAAAHYLQAVSLDPSLQAAADELTDLSISTDTSLDNELQVDRLAERLKKLEERTSPILQSLEKLLSQASNLQAVSFELARQKREFASLNDTVEVLKKNTLVSASLRDRPTISEEMLEQILSSISESRAANFQISRNSKSIANALAWQKLADEKFDAISKINDGINVWQGIAQAGIDKLGRSTDRIDKFQSKLTNVENRLKVETENLLQGLPSRSELAVISKRVEDIAQNQNSKSSVLESNEWHDIVDTIRLELSKSFASAEAFVARDKKLDFLESTLEGNQATLLSTISNMEVYLANQNDSITKSDTYQDRVNGLISETKITQDYLVKRMEFIRREMMFEFRHGREGKFDKLESETKIINLEKYNALRIEPRLNLGCGHIPLNGYLNVDVRELPGVDLVAEVSNVPYSTGEVSEIRSAHLLEHFPLEQLRRSLLPYWLSLLKPNGIFIAIVPDADEMIAAAARGDYPFESFREVFFGAQDYEGDYHYNMFTPESLKSLLQEANFFEIKIVDRKRPNGACFEFEIHARAPNSP